MRTYLDLIAKHGTEFATSMWATLMEESNTLYSSNPNSVNDNKNYKYPEQVRNALIVRAVAWKEALILYEKIQALKPPNGLRELPALRPPLPSPRPHTPEEGEDETSS